MTEDEKLIALLENIIADIMADLDKKISSHSALVLSKEVSFIFNQVKAIEGEKVPMKADLIIERLEHVRATGKNRWIARCPAHQDSSPSLVITQPDNERVLIHCHAGCSTGDILDSMGLDWGSFNA